MTPETVVRGLWHRLGLDAQALASLELTSAEPQLPSSFAVGTAAQASIAAAGLAAAEMWRLRTGRREHVAVDMRHAAIEFLSERCLRLDGERVREEWDAVAGTYRCGDGRWVRLHTNLPHHRDGTLKLLQCAHDRASVTEALQRWEAVQLETAAAEAGLVVTAMRSFAEWDAHPQGAAVAQLPVLTIEKIGEAPPLALPPATRPLDGVRVLDLTRIIAGPVAGRTLASHGADVLLVTASHLPAVRSLVIDSGRGKRSAALDLRREDACETLRALLAQAHVFVQGYRPGAIANLGFAPEAAARIRPGIVYVTLSAYGHGGPWANRRGFDSLVQTASGFNHAEAEAAGSDEPKPLPAQALDHATGFLLAAGAMAGLCRRITDGGSWHVRASLAQTATWLRSLGRIANGLAHPKPIGDDIRPFLEETPSGFGRLTAVRHSAQLAETPTRWERPSVPLGTHPAAWENG